MSQERHLARFLVGRWVDAIQAFAPVYEDLLAAALVGIRAALHSRSATMAVRATRVALVEAAKAVRHGLEAFEGAGGGDAVRAFRALRVDVSEAEAKAVGDYVSGLAPASLRAEASRLVSAVKALT